MFISFDFDHDKDLKGDLVAFARRQETQFSINDSSLLEKQPADMWYAEANHRISKCVVFIVILGLYTYQARGVLREVSMAKGLNRPRFQLRTRKRSGPPLPVQDAGEVVPWTAANLEERLTTDQGRIRTA